MLNAIQCMYESEQPSAEVRDQLCDWRVTSSRTDWENVVRGGNKLITLPAPSTSSVLIRAPSELLSEQQKADCGYSGMQCEWVEWGKRCDGVLGRRSPDKLKLETNSERCSVRLRYTYRENVIQLPEWNVSIEWHLTKNSADVKQTRFFLLPVHAWRRLSDCLLKIWRI